MGQSQLLRHISRIDSTSEFDNDYTIVDWLTQYSEEKDVDLCTWFPRTVCLFAGDDGVKESKSTLRWRKSALPVI